jgi:hypothetical protein
MSELSNVRVEKHSRFPLDVLKFDFRGLDIETFPGSQKETMLNAGWAFLGKEVPGSPDSTFITNEDGKQVKVGVDCFTDNPEVLKLYKEYRHLV